MYGLTGQVYKPEDDTLAPGEKDETPPRPQPTPRPPMPAPMRQEHRNEPRPEPRFEPRNEPRNEPRPTPEGDADLEPPMAAPAAPRASNPKLEKYRDMLTQISGSSKARILNDNDSIAAEVPVRALVETLRTNRQARAVVFDGIITQRILDIASEIGMRSVVGMKMGTITKQPSGIEVYTKTDLTLP
jgi:hypothetical protein